MANNTLAPAEDASDTTAYEIEAPPVAALATLSLTLVTPALTLTAGGPGEVCAVVTNLTSGASYTVYCTSGVGSPTVSYVLNQATTFTASHLVEGGTYTFTATALLGDGTNATSAPATISIN